MLDNAYINTFLVNIYMRKYVLYGNASDFLNLIQKYIGTLKSSKIIQGNNHLLRGNLMTMNMCVSLMTAFLKEGVHTASQ